MSYRAGAATRNGAVPLTATPQSIGLGAWSDKRRALSRLPLRLVPVRPWSVPSASCCSLTGWTIGTGAGERRVCRFAGELDGSGAAGSRTVGSDEQSTASPDLAGPAAPQNFLVIDGRENCPAGDPSGTPVGFVDRGTLPHQP